MDLSTMNSWQLDMLVLPAWMPRLSSISMTILAVPMSLILYVLIKYTILHPLAQYPGPFLAKFTNLYSAYHAWKGDIHVDMYRCHQKYGDYVRYAPNRLLINTPGAITDIYSHQAKNIRKYKNYTVLTQQAPSLLTMQDKAQHSRRRRVLSQAFSKQRLESLEPSILSRLDRFSGVVRSYLAPVDNLTKTEWTAPVNVADLYDHLTFDMMTAVSFDMDFDTMRIPKYRYVPAAIQASNVRFGVLLQAAEVAAAKLVDRYLFPSQMLAGFKFVGFIRRLLAKRLQFPEGDHGDLFSFLQKCRDPDTGEGLTLAELSTETATFIVAGSDTTSTTMGALSHYLTGSSNCYRRAVDEIRSTFSSLEDIKLGSKLNSCVFLRACLDETLRMSPPGGSSMWREVEDGGAIIDGSYIPGGCEVGIGIYSIHHNPVYYTDPSHFDPDRWLQGNESTALSRTAYMPFLLGSRGCIGKPLALAQLMLTFTRLLWEFDIRRASSDDNWETQGHMPTEYVLKDHVTAHNDGPILCFRPRFQSGHETAMM